VKPHDAGHIAREYAVEHHRVHLHVEVQRGSKTLHDHDSPTPTIRDAAHPSLPTVPAKDRPHIHRNDCPTQGMVPRQDVPHPRWQRQHPLSYRYIRKDIVHQMRRALGHTASTTTGTEPSAFAQERDEPRQTVPVARLFHVRAKRLVVIAHNL